MRYKMSHDLEVGDKIKVGGNVIAIESVQKRGRVDADVEISGFIYVAPTKRVVLGLAKNIPIKTLSY
jgi:hypothetical protein